MKLGILDQSPILSGHTAGEALRETLQLAKRADELGYHRYWLAEHHESIDAPVPTVAEAEAHAWTDIERRYVEQERARLVHGDPDTVRTKLLRLAEHTQADVLMLITITGDYASRRRSYELLAKAFALS